MIKNTSGFTLIELLVVIAIIGILATISIMSFSAIQTGARNNQRSSRITVLSESLEKYYDKNGEYPSCSDMMQTPATIVSNTLKDIDPNVLASPTAANGTNSITSCTGDPATDVFVYIGGGTQYTLKYLEEGTGNVVSTNSRRPNTTVTPGLPATPIVTQSTPGGTNTTFSWNTASCPGNFTRYIYRYTISPSGYDSGLVSTTVTSLKFSTRDQNQTYTLAVQAECWNAAKTSGLSGTGTVAYLRPASNWLGGVAGTVMEDKYVYNADNGNSGWQSGGGSYCGGPACVMGVDPAYPTSMALSKDNSVYFSIYYPRTVCQSLTGRLPYTAELLSIASNRSQYGNNFSSGGNYWTGTHDTTGYFHPTYGYYAFTVNFVADGSGSLGHILVLSGGASFRCVKD